MDVERTMQFILENQAQFSADMLTLDERMLAFDQRMLAFDERMLAFDARMGTFAERMVAFGERMVAFDERTVAMERKLDRVVTVVANLAGAMEKLAEAQQHTDERLSALINFVDGRLNGPRQ